MADGGPMDGGEFVVRLRGLPWSVTAQELVEFFHDCNIVDGENGVHLTYTKDGRPSGEAFLELHTDEDMQKALAHNNEHMGKRYIEVFESKYQEMDWVVKRMTPGEGAEGEGVIRLRGLPYGASKQDIATFFSGLEIAPYGITITLDQDGRCTGDAYVEFQTPAEAEKALQKHKEKIGHRYIEIFKSSKSDIKYVVGPKPKPLMSVRPGPYDRPPFAGRARGRGGFGPSGYSDFFGDNFGPSGFSSGGRGGRGRGGRNQAMGGRGRGGGGGGGSRGLQVMNSTTGHSVHMRGLPFEATQGDIEAFFSPLNPVSIRIIYEATGRAKGEADVDFASHEDARAAMEKHKQNMGHRYIELFLQSTPGGSGSVGGWGGAPGASRGGGGGLSGFGGRGVRPRLADVGSNRDQSYVNHRRMAPVMPGYSSGKGGSGSYGGGYGNNNGLSGFQSTGSGFGNTTGSNSFGTGSGGFGLGGSGGSGYGNNSSGYGNQGLGGSNTGSGFNNDVTYPNVGSFFGQSYR